MSVTRQAIRLGLLLTACGAPGPEFSFQTAGSASLGVPDPTLRIRYYHDDHLYSASVITDTAGQLVGEFAFHPFSVVRAVFGERLVQEPYQFTQKEKARESALDYFSARYYREEITRWLSPHPVGKDDANPYVYAKTNPNRFVDPEGHDDWDPGELRDLAGSLGATPARASIWKMSATKPR